MPNMFPYSPLNGPPLPQGIFPPWPWRQGGDPVRIAYKELDAGLDRLTEEKRKEWLEKGYRPGLIDKALLWARSWTGGMISSSLYSGAPEEVKEDISKSLYKTALDRAERYILAFAE